jgi:hypothetical protein
MRNYYKKSLTKQSEQINKRRRFRRKIRLFRRQSAGERLMVSHGSLALLTDLYQLTMAQAYFNDDKTERATFSLFIRSYPLNRGFFISAGLHDVVKFLENFALDEPALRLSINAASLYA